MHIAFLLTHWWPEMWLWPAEERSNCRFLFHFRFSTSSHGSQIVSNAAFSTEQLLQKERSMHRLIKMLLPYLRSRNRFFPRRQLTKCRLYDDVNLCHWCWAHRYEKQIRRLTFRARCFCRIESINVYRKSSGLHSNCNRKGDD